MIKMLALYKKPADAAAFLAYYENTHTPLVKKIPGLASLTLKRAAPSPMGEAPYWLIAEMAYPDRATFDAALASPEQRAVGKDVRNFAADLITVMVVEEENVPL